MTSPSEGQEEPAPSSEEWSFEEVQRGSIEVLIVHKGADPRGSIEVLNYEEKAAWVSILEKLNSTYRGLLSE